MYVTTKLRAAAVSGALALAIVSGVAASAADFAVRDASFTYVYGDGDELLRVVRHETGEVTEYTTGVYGRILARNGAAFSYDGAGRRTEDDRFSYRWTWRGELHSVTVKPASPDTAEATPYAGHRIRYIYDAQGRLLSRDHYGVLPPGGTEADRPFIELREFVWEGEGLVAEIAYGSPDKSQPRWRRTYVPGPAGLDDALQVAVAVDPTFPGSPYAGETRLYTYIRDEVGTVVALVGEDEAPAVDGQPSLAVRYQYTPFGESHAEISPELRRAWFDDERTSAGGVEQHVSDQVADAAGAIALLWSLPLDPATLATGIIAERRVPFGGWEPIPGVVVAPVSASDGRTVLVMPASGWPRASSYRVRITAALRDAVGRRFGATMPLEWSVPAAPADGPIPAISYEQSFPLRFESWGAAAETAGGRFPGGQPMLFQGVWTDPVSGLSYHRARWYDPRTASWLTEDPAGSRDSPNLYAFVGWQPHQAADPYGLEKMITVTASGRAVQDEEITGTDLYRMLIAARHTPTDASRIVVEAGMGGDIGADKTAAMAPYVVAAGRLATRLYLGSVGAGVGAGFAGAAATTYGLGFLASNVLAGSAGGLGHQIGIDVAEGRISSGGDYGLSMAEGVGGSLLIGGVARILGSPGGSLAAPEAGAAAEPSPRAGGLRVLNPDFTPDAHAVLQNITAARNEVLAADPALARTVLSPLEYAAGQRAPWLARMQYGNALERLAAREIRSAALHRSLFQRVGGSSNPDFVGQLGSPAAGMNFDITTAAQVGAHLNRPGYGLGLKVVTYERPQGFSLFP